MIDWLKALFGKPDGPTIAPRVAPPRPPAEAPADAAAIEDEMRACVEREVRGGYSDREGAIRYGVEMFIDEADAGVLQPMAERLVDEALAAHQSESATWPEVTDYDRLAAAFAALERNGVVARENFTCCGTCGAAEIWDEIATADAKGGASRGYAFFHMQDTENAVDGGGLYLNYGACAEGEPAALAVAREIVAAIEHAGLTAHWNGSYQQRIGVALDWKRRRAG